MFLKNRTHQLVSVLAILLIPALPASLAADEKSGGNYSYCRGPGYSEPRGFGYADSRQWRTDYPEGAEDERDAFLERTRDLRREINAKERALGEELDRTDLDKDRAMQLQKELSALRSQMEQYRLEHVIEMRKIAPGKSTEMEEK